MITPSFSLTATERVLPKLALDFTTANLDSRVTFTRTTDATHPATYTNSSGYVTAATNNQARFDYDPVTLACKGLLIEESRSNIITYSSDFTNAAWTASNCNVTGASTTAPDGTLTGCLITSTSTSDSGVYRLPSISGTNAWTIYAKAGTGRYLFLNTMFPVVCAKFDLISGVVVGTPSAGLTASITNVGNGWYRCSAVTAFANSARFTVFITNNTTNTDTTSSVGLSCYLWGAQLETGAFATSYIPTTSAALTRNADVATMTGTNFSDWWNNSQGTLVTYATSNASTALALSFANNVTNNDVINVYYGTPAAPAFLCQATTVSCSIGTHAATGKVAGAYKLNDFAVSVNSNAVVTDTSGNVPVPIMGRLGARYYDGALNLNGYLIKLFYYPLRLTNAELQAFSK